MPAFKTFHVEYQNDIAIVKLQEKRIYMKKSDQFREEANQFLEKGDKQIIVDLSGVNVMNSAGLGVLIAMQTEIDKRKGRLTIVGLQPLMQEIFTRMRLEELFELEESVEKALEKMHK